MSRPKLHKIKLDIEYCDAVLEGIKPFEVRKNDWLYQKGDLIKFIPVENREGVSFDGTIYQYVVEVDHPIERETYQITFVVSGRGVSPEYVVLGIERIEL